MVGGYDPSYVMDSMPDYEIDIALSGLYLSDKEDWERTRLLYYVTCQVNSRKNLSPNEVMPLPWDKEMPEEDTEEDHDRIKSMMESIVKEKNNGS